jgi:peptide/nickel transport system substrate-binding protein
MQRVLKHVAVLAVALACVAVAAGCGSSSSNSSSSTSSGGAGTPHKGGTLIVLENSNWDIADPAQNYTLAEWQLLIDTHDGLVGFQRTSGTAGNTIVPDLASSIPTPTDGGKTWTFHLRSGIKYSDGTPLKASDVTFTMERQFTVPGPTTFYSDIVGASACKPSHCDLSKGVVADDAANTVTFHLTQADPELLDKLSLPFAFIVPKSTGFKLTGDKIPPGTGPYMWKQYDPNKQALLVRNPYFHQWSAAAQPNGYPNEILIKFGNTVENEVTAVENGQADFVFDQDGIPADRLNEISTKYASQAQVNSLTADYYFALNVNIPPFNNLQARQAANYAVDRGAMVKIYGGPQLAAPTCQVLPPNFPGYKPYCPYTKGGSSTTTKWTAPDIAKAKQLLQSAGLTGAKVAVVGTTDEVGKALTLQLVSDLNKAGFSASSKLLQPGPQYPYIQNSDNNVQVGYSQWYQDYPAASDFLNVLLGCSNFHKGSTASPNISGYCNKSIQSQMDSALTKGITDASAANDQWAQIDHAVTDQAPWISLFNPKQIDFHSKRVHGYMWSPQWYSLLDQCWVD